MNNAGLHRNITRLMVWVLLLGPMLPTMQGVSNTMHQSGSVVYAVLAIDDCTSVVREEPCPDCPDYMMHSLSSLHCPEGSCSGYAAFGTPLFDGASVTSIQVTELPLFLPGQIPRPDPRPPKR